MIARINKIRNLGSVFRDYTRAGTLPDFRRFNLIFGWNGSGKTTLSRLFDEVGEPGRDPSIEYEIEDASGTRHHRGDVFPIGTRVFNQDYIERNIQVLEGTASSITILLGEENKDLIDQIAADERVLSGNPQDAHDRGKRGSLEEAEKNLRQKQKDRAGHFTSIARTIGAIGGLAVRAYRKPNAEKDFKSLASKQILSDEELEQNHLTLKQSALPSIEPVRSTLTVDAGKEIDLSERASELTGYARRSLTQVAESKVIARLAQNPELSEWVEHGVRLHKDLESPACEYCQQEIPAARDDELGQHFNPEDARLKSDVDELAASVDGLESFIRGIVAPDEANLYDELRTDYSAAKSQLEERQRVFLEGLVALREEIQRKKTRTSEPVDLDREPDPSELSVAIRAINEVISQHNRKSEGFSSQLEKATERIKTHHLSIIFDDVKSLDSDIAQLQDVISKLEDGDPDSPEDLGVKAIEERIAKNRSQVSSSHKAASEINEGLKKFLGHDELSFEPLKDEIPDENGQTRVVDAGYAILRRGERARSLSEGEKTAIAFVYFTVHLKDADFKVKEGIVVIDDPISSLDANLLFRVSTYIQTHLRSSAQLFVLTHNYDFFNQLKKWFFNDLNRDQDEAKHEGQFFMLTNTYDEARPGRAAVLSELDDLLRIHESEYHYLFKKLQSFDEDNPGAPGQPLEAIYDYPNLARKFLECFLSFRVPRRGSFYTRMMGLRSLNKSISTDDLNYVYSFVNSHSHLDTKSGLVQFDPTLPLTASDSIRTLLKVVEQADEKHVKAMRKECSR